MSARIKESVVEIESGKKALIPFSQRYFFHVESPFFLGRTINNDPFSFSVHEGIVYSCDVLLRRRLSSIVDYQSSETGLSFFSLKCVSNDTCSVGGRLGKRGEARAMARIKNDRMS